MIVYVLMLCSFAVATTEFVLVGLLPQVSSSLSVSLPAAGQLVTAYMIVVTVGGPVATLLTRRVDRRTLLLATMSLALVSAAASALATSYPALLVARLGSALAQALFMAVASQVAMSVSAPERRTAAVARVFNGFALATVVGLPVGTLVGHSYGWHAPFVLVVALSAAGLAGTAALCPRLPAPGRDATRVPLRGALGGGVAAGLAITLLALTGFVASFTYVAPMLRDVTGLGQGQIGAMLIVYGLGTLAGNAVAGRVPTKAIVRLAPVPLAVLAVALVLQRAALATWPTAVLDLFVMGVGAFAVTPLVQTWLMGRVPPALAGVIAAVNISVAGLAAALGAGLGGVIIGTGGGAGWIGPAAAVPVALALAVSVGLAARRPRPDVPPAPVAGQPAAPGRPARSARS